MIAPWNFQCKSLHIQFDAKLYSERLTPRISEALNLLPSEAKISHKMLMTISKMHSTCYSENDFIISHEAILKIMIEMHSMQYYFPVLAIVDAPHSIIRGSFLGYTKYIGEIQFGENFSNFKLEGVENAVQFKTSSSEIEDISIFPHLTYRNYRTDDFQAKGLSVLDITNHVASPVSKCTILEANLPFLEKCGITPTSSYKFGMASDSFTVNGAIYV
jgi:hypothetical protein